MKKIFFVVNSIKEFDFKNLIDKYTQENCLCMCSLAMSLVMAGTANIKCFRILRVIRKRLEGEMHYGHNIAINMA